jgi:AcrR family transcriptional regulator
VAFKPSHGRSRLTRMTSTSATSRGAATRERLLGAALELFAAHGFHGTTTALLAARTGMAEGTIYRHFTGKEALYNAVMQRVWGRGEELVTEGPEGRLPAVERLRLVAGRLMLEARGAPAVVRLLLGPVELPVLDAVGRQASDRFRHAVVGVVALGKQEGTIRPGTAELWASIWLVVVAMAAERVAQGTWTPEHPNVALVIEAAVAAIGKVG